MVNKKDFVKLGIIGFSKGNGHPYSFSSIINGYDEEGLKKSGWKVIYDYIKNRDISEVGFPNAKVTHVWSQKPEESKKLAKAAKIDNIVENKKDLIGEVDGIIIARDDYENHYKFVKPFLEKGIKVFIDKPLTVNLKELKWFKYYIKKGQLMSCSGMRYAKELDEIKFNNYFHDLKLINGLVINSWEKYGIHLLDAIYSVINNKPISVESIGENYSVIKINFEDDLTVIITMLGKVAKTFKLDFIGTKKRSSVELNDNFTAFKRTLWHFVKMIEDNYIPIKFDLTKYSLLSIIAGRESLKLNKKIYISELEKRLEEI